MNPLCPKSQQICFACAEPCKAPTINPAATAIPKEPTTPFAGILATVHALSETVGLEHTKEGINKITINVPL
jgi:hypothetical protein